MMFFSTNCTKNEKFLEDIGVCTSISNADTLATYGYAYIEEGVRRFLVPEKSEEEFNTIWQQAKEARLSVKACNSFLPGNLKSVGSEAVPKEILDFAETAFRRAQLAGVEIIVFGSGGSRSIPEGFPRNEARIQFINLCTDMAPIAAKYDVTVVLEPLNKTECNFINSVEEGGKIVEEINHPNFMLLADVYHMLMEDEGPESILKYGHLIRHTHIAEEKERAAPGTYNEDFRPYFKALNEVNYTGRMSVECRWSNIQEQAETSIKTIREQLASI